MGVKLVVAVTDGEWFKFLRGKRDLTEVNFWKPSAQPFKSLERGELFLFKLKAPHNVIVGGGVFTHASIMPCSLAWDTFGEANGAASAWRLRELIASLKPRAASTAYDFDIGCRVLTGPFFFEESEWLPAPSFSRNIVTHKTYSTDELDGLRLWDAVHERLGRMSGLLLAGATERYGRPRLIRPRLGQGAFRAVVTDVYGRRCAVTRERTLPALEAAHIRPYSDGGTHEESNGLLLRRDLHSLFDAGYVTVTPDLHFEVSGSIKEKYENGRDYYALHGREISAPVVVEQRPDPALLAWHNENCFMG